MKDLTWFRCDGKEMTQDDWTNPITRCFGLRLAGDAILEPDALGQRIVDDTFLVMLNAHHEPMGFTVPAHRDGTQWETVLDTREPTGKTKRRAMPGGETYDMEARSLVVLRLRRENAKQDDEEEEADVAEQTTPTESAPRRIRINTANRQELLEVPGLRPDEAEAIVRFRDEHSDFLAYVNLWRYLLEQQRTLSGSAFRRRCKAEYLHYLRVREWQDPPPFGAPRQSRGAPL